MVTKNKHIETLRVAGVITDPVLREKVTELLTLHGVKDVLLAGALKSFAENIKTHDAQNKPVIIFQGLDKTAQNEITALCHYNFNEDLFQIAIADLADDNTASAQNDHISLLPQPFRPGSLLDLLIYAAKRAQSAHTKKSYQIAHFTFEPVLLTLKPKKGEAVKLTEKERDVLLLLLNTEDHTISREDLLEIVWGYRPDTETHTAETHIYRLRQKIEKDPSAPEIVLTVPDGYELNI